MWLWRKMEVILKNKVGKYSIQKVHKYHKSYVKEFKRIVQEINEITHGMSRNENIII